MEMDILEIMGTELKILVQTTNLSCNNESQDDVGIGIRIISAHYLLDGCSIIPHGVILIVKTEKCN